LTGAEEDLAYCSPKVVGNGSFGVVFKAQTDKGAAIAIKRVLQDKRFKVITPWSASYPK